VPGVSSKRPDGRLNYGPKSRTEHGSGDAKQHSARPSVWAATPFQPKKKPLTPPIPIQ